MQVLHYILKLSLKTMKFITILVLCPCDPRLNQESHLNFNIIIIFIINKKNIYNYNKLKYIMKLVLNFLKILIIEF